MQLISLLILISFQWFAEHAWLSLFTIFFLNMIYDIWKKKSYPDIIGFTIFSTYTQKINQGLLQNWWVKTLFERVLNQIYEQFMKIDEIKFHKYLVKTEQVQNNQKLFQHIVLFEVKILAAAKPYIHFCRHMYVLSLIWYQTFLRIS